MKLHQDENFQTTLDNQTALTIQASTKAFKILSRNLYSNSVAAVCREIVSNAVDAHIQAGITTPPRVTLPTASSPSFIVEDFGVGMSEETIDNVYSSYFASTKNQSNELIGGFGLGSKSPLAYTDSFLIETTQDYQTRQYVLAFDAQGIPSLSLLATFQDEKECGTKITVPVKAQDFSSFVYNTDEIAETTLLPIFSVNRQILLPQKDEMLADLKEKGYYVEPQQRYYHANYYAVIGGVVYEISNNEISCNLHLITDNDNVYIHFNIGELELQPSREELSYDARTKAIITAKMQRVGEEYTAEMNMLKAQYPQARDLLKACIERFGRVPKPLAEIEKSIELNGSYTGRDSIRLYNGENSEPSVYYPRKDSFGKMLIRALLKGYQLSYIITNNYTDLNYWVRSDNAKEKYIIIAVPLATVGKIENFVSVMEIIGANELKRKDLLEIIRADVNPDYLKEVAQKPVSALIKASDGKEYKSEELKDKHLIPAKQFNTDIARYYQLMKPDIELVPILMNNVKKAQRAGLTFCPDPAARLQYTAFELRTILFYIAAASEDKETFYDRLLNKVLTCITERIYTNNSMESYRICPSVLTDCIHYVPALKAHILEQMEEQFAPYDSGEYNTGIEYNFITSYILSRFDAFDAMCLAISTSIIEYFKAHPLLYTFNPSRISEGNQAFAKAFELLYLQGESE